MALTDIENSEAVVEVPTGTLNSPSDIIFDDVVAEVTATVGGSGETVTIFSS
jgi:hypothetical protein